MTNTFTYGPPCFQDGSVRSITIKTKENNKYSVFFKTSYVQGMLDDVIDVEEALVDLFSAYKSKLKGDDRKLFKSYFENL